MDTPKREDVTLDNPRKDEKKWDGEFMGIDLDAWDAWTVENDRAGSIDDWNEFVALQGKGELQKDGKGGKGELSKGGTGDKESADGIDDSAITLCSQAAASLAIYLIGAVL